MNQFARWIAVVILMLVNTGMAIAREAVCDDPWTNNRLRYNSSTQVLVYDGSGLAVRPRGTSTIDSSRLSDRRDCFTQMQSELIKDKPGTCKCFGFRHEQFQADERARRRAEAGRTLDARMAEQAAAASNPVRPGNLTDSQLREIQRHGELVKIELDLIEGLRKAGRTAEADARLEAIVRQQFNPLQPSAPPAAPGSPGVGSGAGSQPGSTAAVGAAAVVPHRVYVHLPDDGSLRLTGGPTSQACSAFVADVDVRSQIDRTIRSAAPRVQMVADGSGAHRIGVGQFSWECFRKYPDWGMTIRLTLSASPSSIGAGGEVSGERTVFGPGAPECFTIECAAQKHRREFNPLVEGLAGELASKLVAQLQPTAPPAGVAITPAQFAQAPSGNAGREPGSVPGGTPSAGVGATGQGGGSGRLDSSTLGRVNTSSYWCNSLGGQGGGDSSNEECVVPVPPSPNACAEVEHYPDLDERVARYNGANNELARLHAANRAGRCDSSVPISGILNALVQYRWLSFRGSDAARGAEGERACDPQFTGWQDARCDRRAYTLYFIYACAAQRCVFDKR
ncbi:MAG: hypothetical protein IPH39_15895 [Sulfuritalea sp.]|nr:hypothetical protein [Sulfuritalea sp.]